MFLICYHSHKEKCDCLLLFPGLRIRIHFIRIQHFRLNTDLDPDAIRIQGFNDQKLKNITYSCKKKKKIFRSKPIICVSLGLHKERLSYRRSLQFSKEAIQHFKTWIFKFFSTFAGHFWPPGCGSGSGSTDPIESGSTDPIESGSNWDPDPQPWLFPLSPCPL